MENRNLRETKYERKREDIVYQAQQQEEYLFGCLQEERNRDIEQKTIRQKELAIEHQTGKRIEHYQMCDQLMDFIFEAAEVNPRENRWVLKSFVTIVVLPAPARQRH